LLSSDGNIYAFGDKRLENQKEENELSPYRIKIETKFIDIFSRWIYYKGFSMALSQEGIYYNWQMWRRNYSNTKTNKFRIFC
jgi:hypothetical protein